MHSRTTRLPTVSCLLVCLLPVSAAGQPSVLTIVEAIDIAQQSNLALKRSRTQVELARIDVDGSRAAFYPTVSAQASSSGRIQSQSSDSTRTASASVGSSLNLFRGFADRSALESNEQLLAAGQGDLERQRQSAVFDTISAYLQVVAWQEYVEVSRQHLDAQLRSLEQIQAYQRAGKRPIADVYQQQAEVAEAQLRLLTAERDLQVGKLLLLQVLGRAPDAPVEVSPVDVDALIAELETDASAGRAERPDLLAQQHRIQAATEQIDVAWAGYLPSLGLYLEAVSSYDSGSAESFADQTTDDRLGVTVGLTLSIPLFDAEIATRVEHAEVEQVHARLVLEQLEHQARVEIVEAEMDYDAVREQLALAESRLASAAQSLAALEERYRVGSGTLVELSLMRAQHLEATYESVNTKYDLLLSAVAVQYQRGELAGMVSLFENGGAS